MSCQSATLAHALAERTNHPALEMWKQFGEESDFPRVMGGASGRGCSPGLLTPHPVLSAVQYAPRSDKSLLIPQNPTQSVHGPTTSSSPSQ